jgi:hypothetical protein
MTECIIEASGEHPADRIRNTTSGQGDMGDYKQADRVTSEGA